MPESTIYPSIIEIDTIIKGVARLLCHWAIEGVLREDSLVYQYEEAVIKWTLPESYLNGEQTAMIATREDAEAYVLMNSAEIMTFAKATKLTM